LRYLLGGNRQTWGTYSPPLTELIPKLEPTTPVQVHVSPAALVYLAVADLPTLRHVTDAAESEMDAERNRKVAH
jgi:hypothetical protein